MDPEVQWAAISNLPKAAAAILDREFTRTSSTVVHTQHSRNGETSKMLLRLQDGLTVEAVIMHYDTSGPRYSTAMGPPPPLSPPFPLPVVLNLCAVSVECFPKQPGCARCA